MPALPTNLWLEGNNTESLIPIMFQINRNKSDESARTCDFNEFTCDVNEFHRSMIKIDDELKLIKKTIHHRIANIVVLNPSANGILNVDFGAIRYLNYLTILHLSRKKNSEFQEDILYNMPVLYYINLANTKIKFFPKICSRSSLN